VAGGLAACLSERERPAPPLLRVTLNELQVFSPDTLSGSVRVEDPDGIDSVWVTLDAQKAGQDGGFETVFEATFRFGIPSGLPAGTVLPLRIEARDIAGFTGGLDTSVIVIQ
jgi:hypothetical protein